MIKNTKLVEIAKRNETSYGMFMLWSLRERNTTHTDMRQFRAQLRREKFKVNEKDFFRVFEELAALGIGQIGYGRGNRPRYFSWNKRIKDVGLAGVYAENTEKSSAHKAEILRVIDKNRHEFVLEIGLDSGKVVSLRAKEPITADDVQAVTKYMKEAFK